VESTLAEVLILHGLGEDGCYEVVIWVGLKVLGEFEGRRGGGAYLWGTGRPSARLLLDSIAHYYYLSRINCKWFVWCGLTEEKIDTWSDQPGATI
jgi:hypothetical protein